MKTKLSLILLLVILTPNFALPQIVINEVCSSNDTISVATGYYDDWIELRNVSDRPVSINGWHISDSQKKPEKFTFSGNYVINPGSYFLVFCNGIGSGRETNFKLSSDGETVLLSNPQGEIVDKVTLPPLFEDRSYGRIDGTDDWGVYEHATPGAANFAGAALAPAPIFSVKAGFYTSAQKVAISCDNPDAKIYYTTNGSEPTASSSLYTDPVYIGSNKVLRAIAIVNGRKRSNITTATYFINSRKIDLPVISLSTDRDNFYSNTKGIYVVGTNGIQAYCSEGKRNWNQKWERPIHFEYFDKDKNLQLSIDAGVRITGSCSRNNDQKSLRIIARKEYGPKRLEYKFFPQKDISEFKSIVLRSGANDWAYTMIRDALISLTAASNMDIDYQGYQPAAVFLNGEYFGLHNIREKVSTHFAQENYGVDDDIVNLLENNYSIIDGVNSGYVNNVHNFARDNDLSIESNYRKICEYMDIDNFIDYWILQIYVDNYDWPGNNIKFWNSKAKNSKWRWILFGSEYSSNLYSNDNQAAAESLKRSLSGDNSYWAVPNWSSQVINKLLKNQEFKSKFIQRFSYHIQTTFNPDDVVARIDSLQNLIKNEFPYESQRWFSWHNVNGWNTLCDRFRTWFRLRPEQMRKQIRNYFGVNEYNVKAVADNSAVKFLVNDYLVGSEIDAPYYGGVNLKLSAKLPKDLEVDYWQVDGRSSSQHQLFGNASDWKYFANGKAVASDWTTSPTVDNGWASGKAPLGYSGMNYETTKISYGYDANNKYAAYYFRKKVNIDGDPSTWSSATLQLKVDDGAVVYVNGVEVARDLISGTPYYNTWASNYKGGVNEVPFDTYSIPTWVFQKGENIIAVEVHQCSATSSDIVFDASMSYTISGEESSQKVYASEYSFVPGSDVSVKLFTKQSTKPEIPESFAKDNNANSLVINEVQNYNAGSLASDDNRYGSWVEIFNNSSVSVDMAGLYLSDGKYYYMIPFYQETLTTVPARSHIVFYLDGKYALNALHTPFVLDNKPTTLTLYHNDGEIISEMLVPELLKNQSYGCKSDASKELVTFSRSSPYGSNLQGTITRTLPVLTDVDDVEASVFEVSIYPNPATDIVNIKVNVDKVDYEVIDLRGRVHLSGHTNQINVSGLAPGFYLVKVNGEVKKLIKI